MGIADFIKKLLGNKTVNSTLAQTPIVPANSSRYPNEYQAVISFNLAIDSLLQLDKYIARSDYRDIVQQYKDLPEFYGALNKSGLLGDYISKHTLNKAQIDTFLSRYNEMKDLQNEAPTIRIHNDAFIRKHLKSEKEYLDNILKACDPAISLDEEQREVVLSDEDHTLVIAGAGAGKTTTVAAKVPF